MDQKYVALLRGINVGGHKKVPMAEMRALMEKNGFKKVKTLLASGNVVFESTEDKTDALQALIESHFKFSVDTLIFPKSLINDIVSEKPFEKIEVTKDIRLYVSFFHTNMNSTISLPYSNEDGSFKILKDSDHTAYSVLDLKEMGSVDGMKVLEKAYGNSITTRNYNTVVKIHAL